MQDKRINEVMEQIFIGHCYFAKEFKNDSQNIDNTFQTKTRVHSFLLSLIFVISFTLVNATNYYVSNSGNDSNPGSGESLPWRSLAKINSFTPSPGDRILFKRGEEWYGTLTVNASGSSGNPIVYGAYGEGPDPVISGFTTITSGWTNEGGGIYSKIIASESQTNMVTIDGKNTGMGRFPNEGEAYLTYENFNTTISITDNQLIGTPNWTGAELVMRVNNYRWRRVKIGSHIGTTLAYTTLSTENGTAGNGYFIQNNIRTLDKLGEWYHNDTTGVFYMYFGSESPGDYTVNVATKENLFTTTGKAYITVSDLSFQGSISDAITNITRSDNFTLQNCDISFAGYNGINVNGENSLIDNNTTIDCANSGIVGVGPLITLTNNTVRRSGMIIGGFKSLPNGIMTLTNNDGLIQYNIVDSCGGHGIRVNGSDLQVKNNFVNYAVHRLNDEGGIYCSRGALDTQGIIIDGNIVLNTIGYPEGGENATRWAFGIILDYNSDHVTVTNNTVAFNRSSGLQTNNANNILIEDNTSFDNKTGIIIQNTKANENNSFNNTVRYNKFISTGTNYVAQFKDLNTSLPTSNIGVVNYNVYTRPADDDYTIVYQYSGSSQKVGTLKQWQTFSGLDANSTKSPQAIKSDNDLQFEYNAAKSNKIISLSQPMIDITGAKYTESVTLLPYTSVILMPDPDPDVIDTNKPTITDFTIPGTSSNLSVPVSSFIASDNVGVTGYLLTESNTTPSAGSDNWTSTAPTSYTLSSQGSKTLYAWVKDAAGNVSNSASATIMVITSTTSPGNTTYYISNSGDDGDNGTSTSTPWKTLDKVNAFTFSKGDNILFKRGDTWYGTITVSNSGADGNPITYGTYGTGEKPIITGFTTITDWINEGNGIWSKVISSESQTNMVTIDGKNTGMGRFPNEGEAYLTYENFNTTISITDNQLIGTPNWTGAELVMRVNNYRWRRVKIGSHIGTTLAYTTLSTENGTAGNGYFIQNNIRTLDKLGEWYHNDTTGVFYMYFGSESPGDYTVNVATKENLFTTTGKAYITVSDLSFQGSISDAITNITRSDNFTLQNCDISFAGYNGINVNGENSLIDNNTTIDCANSGIVGVGPLITLTNNTVRRSGMIIGGFKSLPNGIMTLTNNDGLIQYNIVDSCGGHGIRVNGSDLQVKNNFVNYAVHRLNDEGGIYCSRGALDTQGIIIDGNIVLNTIGYPEGGENATRWAFGIILDYNSDHVTVTNNTVAFNRSSGLQTNNANNILIEDNTSFDNKTGIIIQNTKANENNSFNNTVRYNKFISTGTNYVAQFKDLNTSLPTSNIGVVNYNVYTRPADDDYTIVYQYSGSSQKVGTLKQWQTFSGLDANSTKSPQAIKSDNDLQFEYNAAKSNKIISLSQPMIDITGAKYTESVTLLPYTSVILMPDPDPDVIDTNKPTITDFTIPGTSSNLSVPVSSFIASDNVGVTGYLLTESNTTPSAGSDNWTSTAPTSYTLSSQGSKTLYAWVKDAAGNVSNSASATIMVITSTTSPGNTTYYISNSGDDGDNGTSTSTPWKTLDKVNAFTFSKGDNILFKRGDTWYGTITVSNSGADGNPITYGTYGTGEKPIITGFTTITDWINEGNGIWSKVISSESQTNMVTINGKNTGMGRYPNTGKPYLTYESFNTSISITDNQLSGTPDWTGADLIKRPEDWVWERCKITNHSGTTITYDDPYANYTGHAGNGYFIQNDLRTLDQVGEWYHDYASTGKFYMYFGSETPSSYTVKVATKKSLITNAGKQYVEIRNLDIQGSIQDAVYNSSLSNNFTIQNCDISFAGDYGVKINSQNGLVDGNSIYDCNQGAVRGMSAMVNVTNNNIHRIGLIVGSSKLYYNAIMIANDKNDVLIQYNNIDSVGGCGVRADGQNLVIKNNFVNYTCLVLNDFGGIYTGGNQPGTFIDHNIVLNTIGNANGGNTAVSISEGIYLDSGMSGSTLIDPAGHYTVTSNTSAFNGYSGIKLHMGSNCRIENNTCFANNKAGLYIINSANNQNTLHNDTIRYNQFIAKWGQQALMIREANTSVADPSGIGIFDHNVYARPIKDSQIFQTYYNKTWAYRTLTQWQSYTGHDANSQGSPYSVVSDDSLILVYNADKVANNIALPFSIKTLDGTQYSGSVYLQPYSSMIGFYAGEKAINQSPVIFQSGNVHIYPNPASNEVTIQFPTSSEMGTKIELADITGRVVMSRIVRSEFEVLDIQSQLSGMYFVKTFFQNGYNIQKLIIN
jgi:parallel beta-helix repeat protein